MWREKRNQSPPTPCWNIVQHHTEREMEYSSTHMWNEFVERHRWEMWRSGKYDRVGAMLPHVFTSFNHLQSTTLIIRIKATHIIPSATLSIRNRFPKTIKKKTSNRKHFFFCFISWHERFEFSRSISKCICFAYSLRSCVYGSSTSWWGL